MDMQDLQVLLIEDEDSICATMATTLGERGLMVITANNGHNGYRIASESTVDIVLLDLGLPDIDGVSLIPMLQQVSNAPIVVISARQQELQKVAALDAGADDYLTKPFGVDELLARIRSTLRRSQRAHREAHKMRYEYDELCIDLEKHEVWLSGRSVRLTPVEFKLLTMLMKRAGKVITHRQLLREVWGPLHEEDSHYLRIYMRQLRSKLEKDPTQPKFLLTEPGIGYRLAGE